jgi:hypothetical protein
MSGIPPSRPAGAGAGLAAAAFVGPVPLLI